MSSEPRSRKGRVALLLLALLVVAAGAGALYLLKRYPNDVPVVHADPLMHFKHGSIGGDTDNGLPKRIMQVLPEVFADLLPPGAPQDWTAFGFQVEPGQWVPVGFSERTMRVPLLGMNCALCHVGAVRTAPDAEPQWVLGLGAPTLDLGAFFEFLFRAVADPRFTPDVLLPAMEAKAPMDWIDRLVYARVIPTFKAGLQARQKLLAQLFDPARPPMGPGRIDTFNPYKLSTLGEHYPQGLGVEEAIGTSRYPAIWAQEKKRGRPLNWDGNAPRIEDRNAGAAFGAGATYDSIDMVAVAQVHTWLETLEPPKWPFALADTSTVARGGAIYQQMCARCHDDGGADIGQTVPIDAIGTDRRRFDSYTEKLNQLFLDMGNGRPWDLTSMRKTDGYLNRSLEGLWARGPYLHNGSVPTLADLLTPADQRPVTFRVGHGVIDRDRVGQRADVEALAGRPTAIFDTRLPGNSNTGHTGAAYGTELSPEDTQALLEYLKTL